MAITDVKEILAVDFDNVPDYLKGIDAWILWRAEPNGKGEYIKRPKQADGKKAAKVNDPSTWSSFEAVREAYESGVACHGIGFVLTPESEVVFIDVDKSTDAKMAEKGSLRTYAEYSPSGTGVHLYLRGKPKKNYKHKVIVEAHGYELEMYHQGRFMTVTGQRIGDKPDLEADQAFIDRAVDTVFAQKERKNKAQTDAPADAPDAPDDWDGTTDQDIINLMLNSRNGKEIKALLDGDTSSYGEDHSGADMALCNYLAFYTGKDEEQMYRIFCSSGLYREKTDRPTGDSTYIERTIQKAVDEAREVYKPKQGDAAFPSLFSMDGIEFGENGAPKQTRNNINIIFRQAPGLQRLGRLNEFTGFFEIWETPPWRHKEDTNIMWRDIDDAKLRNLIAEKYGMEGKEKIDDIKTSLFYDNKYHPIKDYLNGVSWDGEARLERFFIDFLGADDSDYTRRVTEMQLVAAVDRIFNPGVKHDEAVVLQGAQGAGKSYVLGKLGMEWFNESMIDMKSKEGYMSLKGSWIVDLAELSGVKRVNNEELKSFISATEDVFREPYSKYTVRQPRQNIFFGTTNDAEFLRDETGNRRFLIIPVEKWKRSKNPFNELDQAYVDQVWAEAMHKFKHGVTHHLDDKKDERVIKRAKQLQQEYSYDDGLRGQIESFIEKEIPQDWESLPMYRKQGYYRQGEDDLIIEEDDLVRRDRICAHIIWHEMLGNTKAPTRSDIKWINQKLRNIEGLEPTGHAVTFYGSYGKQRGFYIRDLDGFDDII